MANWRQGQIIIFLATLHISFFLERENKETRRVSFEECEIELAPPFRSLVVGSGSFSLNLNQEETFYWDLCQGVQKSHCQGSPLCLISQQNVFPFSFQGISSSSRTLFFSTKEKEHDYEASVIFYCGLTNHVQIHELHQPFSFSSFSSSSSSKKRKFLVRFSGPQNCENKSHRSKSICRFEQTKERETIFLNEFKKFQKQVGPDLYYLNPCAPLSLEGCEGSYFCRIRDGKGFKLSTKKLEPKKEIPESLIFDSTCKPPKKEKEKTNNFVSVRPICSMKDDFLPEHGAIETIRLSSQNCTFEIDISFPLYRCQVPNITGGFYHTPPDHLPDGLLKFLPKKSRKKRR